MSYPPQLDVLHVPVRTKSGQQLGVVTDVTIDAVTQSVLSYTVRAYRLLPAAITRNLVIHRNQVIGFDETGMMVDDATLGNTAPAAQPAA